MKEIIDVCAIIINSKKEVFVAKRPEEKSLGGKWEFPGGKQEVGESLEETIIREIKEELNSTIKPIKYLGNIEHVYRKMNNSEDFKIIMHAYLCELVDGKLELLEHTDSKWVSLDKLSEIDLADADKILIDDVVEMEMI